VPARVGAPAETKKPLVTIAELADPDSLEAKVAESPEELPRWRLEQEQERARREQDLSQQIAASQSGGDVLQVFEAEMAKPSSHKSEFSERARGVADESEELLPMDALAAPRPGAAVAKLEPAKAEPAPAPPEPASVTQPLAALALLESAVEQPVQLALLGNDAVSPKEEDSLQLELLPEPVGQSG
jgi:hypothetical protein